MSTPAFYDELRTIRLERLLDSSAALITEDGWEKLTMTRVAERSGVPRQSLYKEVGTKSQLGKALVQREVDRFLAGVCEAITVHKTSVSDGLSAATRFALEYGETNAILKAIVHPGHDPQLLEMLTVRPEAVLGRASAAVTTTIDDVHGKSDEALADTMVRLILSHLLQPTTTIDVAVERITRAVSLG